MLPKLAMNTPMQFVAALAERKRRCAYVDARMH